MNAPSLLLETGGLTGGTGGKMPPPGLGPYKLTGDWGNPEISPSMTGGLTRGTPQRQAPVSDLRRVLRAAFLGTAVIWIFAQSRLSLEHKKELHRYRTLHLGDGAQARRPCHPLACAPLANLSLMTQALTEAKYGQSKAI